MTRVFGMHLANVGARSS